MNRRITITANVESNIVDGILIDDFNYKVRSILDDFMSINILGDYEEDSVDTEIEDI